MSIKVISVNAQMHAKLSSLPFMRTNHQPLFDVLHHLPLYLTALVSVTAPKTVLRYIASFASNCCSPLLNNLLLQVKPVHNVSQLFINLQLESTYFWHYMGTYQPSAEVDTIDMSPRLLEAATTATSLQLQPPRRTGLFRAPSSNIYMGPSIDKNPRKLLQKIVVEPRQNKRNMLRNGKKFQEY